MTSQTTCFTLCSIKDSLLTTYKDHSMKKVLLLAGITAALSLNANASDFEHPSKLKWGSKFSNYACGDFDNQEADEPALLAEHNVIFQELGVKDGGMAYGTLNAVYGDGIECEYVVKLARHKEDESLSFNGSRHTPGANCEAGAAALDSFFSKGLNYKQGGGGHTNLSFEVRGSNDGACAGNVFLQFKRTR